MFGKNALKSKSEAVTSKFRTGQNNYIDLCVIKYTFHFVCLFVFGATAPNGSWPPHSRCF